MNEIEPTQSSPAELLRLAIERDLDVEKLRALLDLRERWETGESRKAYCAAMAAAKAAIPAVLPKDALVDFQSAKGRTRYRHASLGAILSAITPVLSQHGLSVAWETEQGEQSVSVTCHVTHVAGHRESVSLQGPPDDSGSKNRLQQIGSSTTYLSRYTLVLALGLATADMDDADDPPTCAIRMPERKSGRKPQVHPVAPVATAPGAEPPPGPVDLLGGQTAKAISAGGLVTGRVAEIVRRESPAGAERAWKFFGVRVGGEIYGTFSSTIAALAAQAEAGGSQVEIAWAPGKKVGTKNIAELRVVGKGGDSA